MLEVWEGDKMILKVNLGERSYDIVIERGALKRAGELFDLKRKVLVVTDSAVPYEYSEQIMSMCSEPFLIVIQQGEKSKNFDNYKLLLETMLENGFTRTDTVVAVGGGVVGDLAGFAASTYMRGIDFYNVPTTVLSQVDSSVGGKTAVDFGEFKNTVGSFYQPKKVLIDFDVLKTLDKRQFSNGLAESVKMAVTFDEDLFSTIENEDIEQNLEKIISRSIELKKQVVEKDEKESGLRKVLNFGHTIGHAIESSFNDDKMFHGECVAVGMMAMCEGKAAERLTKVLKKLSLPTKADFDVQRAVDSVRHDKKFAGDMITVITVGKIGSYEMKTMSTEDIIKTIRDLREVTG